MDTDRALLVGLIFIGLIVGSNVVMYFMVRGSVNKGDSNFMKNLRSLGKTPESESEKSMDELRKRIQDLENKQTGE
jgi:archaellum biogenesis protein FlaJ (TadC family)